MANEFDQFDTATAAPAAAANPFDRFDGPAKAPGAPAGAPEAPKPNLMSVLGKIPGMGIVTGPVEAGAQMLSGAVAKPVSDIAGMAAMAKDAITGAGSEGDAGGFKEQVQSDLTYQPRTDAGKATAKYNPLALLGQATDWLGRMAKERVAPPGASTERQMAGAGVHEAINQAPQFLGPLASKAATGAGGAVTSTARGLMQSALKPKESALLSGKADRAIDTMFEQGLNVSPGGVQTMQGKIASLNSQIAARIAGSPATVNKAAVAARIQPLLQKFMKQVNEADDIAAIQKAHDGFINHPLLTGADMPVQLAQEMKQGTYRALGDKSYGEQKSTSIEAQKALARGLKEEIAKAVPEVHQLNAQESKLLDALSVSERRVMMEANNNPIGFGWLTTDPVRFAGWMADRSGMFKSIVARMLNKAGGAAPAAGNAAAAVAPAVTVEANRSKHAYTDAEKERKYQEWKRRQSEGATQ